MSLADQWNPVSKPSHHRKAPKRGNLTKFSKKVRQQIIERDHGLCVKCHKPYTEIHHVQFASDLGTGTLDNGVAICNGCHILAHKNRAVREWFERYKTKFLEEAK